MDTAKIKEIISIFECSSLSSMHLEADDMKITLKKEGSAAVSAPLSISVPAPEAAAPVQEQPAAPAYRERWFVLRWWARSMPHREPGPSRMWKSAAR